MYNRMSDEQMRNNNLSKLIQRFGFEHPFVITYADRSANVSFNGRGMVRLINLFNYYMSFPVDSDEE